MTGTVDSPFVSRVDGSPVLTRCALLFVDVLGVSAMAESADAAARLVVFDRAIRHAYRNVLRPAVSFSAAMFSDTLVVAAPVVPYGGGEAALRVLTFHAAWLQRALITEGLFVRGALTLGDFHIRRGLLFGRALVEAYRLESSHAIHPASC